MSMSRNLSVPRVTTVLPTVDCYFEPIDWAELNRLRYSITPLMFAAFLATDKMRLVLLSFLIE